MPNKQKLVYTNDELPQGSQEWLDFRSQGIGGSEASALMGIGFTSVNQLWALKTNRVESTFEMNDAMRLGHEREPIARAKYEQETQNGVMEQLCLVHPKFPFFRVSLDGISQDRTQLLEIKCPGINTHTKAVRGNVPDYYVPQLQYQLMVARAVFGVTKSSDYYSYFPIDPLFNLTTDRETVLIENFHDEVYQAELEKRGILFWQCVENDTPPNPEDFKPFSTDTIVERNDSKWKKAAESFLSITQQIKELEQEAAKASDVLKELASTVQADKVIGCGVQVAKASRIGNIDYTAIPQLRGVDLESFRKPTTTYFTIKPTKDGG